MALLVELVAGMTVDPDTVQAITTVNAANGNRFAIAIQLPHAKLITSQTLGVQDAINEVSRMTSLVNSNRTKPPTATRTKS